MRRHLGVIFPVAGGGTLGDVRLGRRKNITGDVKGHESGRKKRFFAGHGRRSANPRRASFGEDFLGRRARRQ